MRRHYFTVTIEFSDGGGYLAQVRTDEDVYIERLSNRDALAKWLAVRARAPIPGGRGTVARKMHGRYRS